MSEPARTAFDQPELGQPAGEEPSARPSVRSRATLLKRLADVVCLPGSRVNAFERSMTADLIVELLREAAMEERVRIARRIANVSEIPTGLARMLMRDDLEVARALLENSATVGDGDLIDCVRSATAEHRRLIASRRGLNEVVGDELVQYDEPAVIEALLRNDLAKLSHEAIETVVAGTRDHPRHIPLLLRRSELRPSHAYVMFWSE